ncbi:MAG: FCD domain-containing protein, partial [Synergistes sp.]|nr:FCD domain-containing protein [Synergistes sp.]
NILSIIENRESPAGSNSIAAELKAREIDVSAPTVGRCLANLENAGYLIPSKNKGRVISDDGRRVLAHAALHQNLNEAAENVKGILSEGSADIKKLIDVLLVRQALEGKSAALAAQNATTEEIASIVTYAEILDTVLQDVNDSRGKNYQETMGRLFHETIAKAAKNEILAASIHLINQNVATRDYLIMLLDKTDYSFGLGHSAIANAIKKRDSEEAKALAEAHLQKVVDALYKLM